MLDTTTIEAMNRALMLEGDEVREFCRLITICGCSGARGYSVLRAVTLAGDCGDRPVKTAFVAVAAACHYRRNALKP